MPQLIPPGGRAESSRIEQSWWAHLSPRGAAPGGGGPGPPQYRLEGAESWGAEAGLPRQDAGFGEEEEERGVMSARQGDQPRPSAQD